MATPTPETRMKSDAIDGAASQVRREQAPLREALATYKPTPESDDRLLYRQIGSKIALRRKDLGWSQERLAKAVGLSRPAIANIEVGRQGVLVHMLYRIAKALFCSPGDLAPKPKIAHREAA